MPMITVTACTTTDPSECGRLDGTAVGWVIRGHRLRCVGVLGVAHDYAAFKEACTYGVCGDFHAVADAGE
ncbi:hypothetical protein FB471_1307 [Amycolatopsis cihanbeyliensis]|uniref:Uncharacterized protein n=1 Tax=Amycolatopsis cihanbeyliensis TaxID=1128664 RepID=A0A542DEV9_AMYCI|nr:hypothetical protein FB471_1307 [Amycolatopsis cihanbeyliensis]